MTRRPTSGARRLALAFLAALSLAPGAGGAADDRLFPSRPPVLLDGTGRLVGLAYAGLDRELLVWHRVEGRDLLLEATPDALESSPATDGSRLGFQAADCSGPPWFLGPRFPVPLVYTEVAPGPDRTLWVADGPPSIASITSTFHPALTSPCQTEPGGFLQLQRAIQILDLKSFPPPFTVR